MTDAYRFYLQMKTKSIEEIQKELEKKARELQIDMQKALDKKPIDNIYRNLRVPHIWLIHFFIYLLSEISKRHYKSEIEKVNFVNSKMEEIKKNFDLLIEIQKDFSFLREEELAKLVFNQELNLQKLREFQLDFLNKMQNSLVEDRENQIDNAIQTIFKFDRNYGLDKKNAFLIKDFVNNKFDVNLTLEDVLKIKKINQKTMDNNLDIDFEKTEFSKKNLDKFLENKKEYEYER